MVNGEACATLCVGVLGCLFFTSGIVFAVLWGGTTPPEAPLWLNVGLCRNETGAKRAMYGSALWFGALDVVTQSNKLGCQNPPLANQASVAKIATKHLVKDYPYYPRIFATDMMDIISMNVTISHGGKVLKTWVFSSTTGEGGKTFNTARRLSTSGRKLLKGGSSSSGTSPSRRSSRTSSSRNYRSGGVGAYAYSNTRYGGSRRRAVEGTAEGFVHAIYSPVHFFGERKMTPGKSHIPTSSSPSAPLNDYENTYNRIPSCTDYNVGCDVTMYSSLSMYEMNGEGIFYEPTKDPTSRGNPDYYEVSSTVKARFDEKSAATTQETGYTTEYPKIFVTFATDREDPNNLLYGTLCITSWIMLFCTVPCGYVCMSICAGSRSNSGYTNTADTKPLVHLATLNNSQTHEIPNNFVVNVDALVQPMRGGYPINKYNNDYTSTDIAGSQSGRVTSINLHTNDVAAIRGLNRMPLLASLDVSNNNLRNLTGLNQSRSIRRLVVDDNDLRSLDGLVSSSLVSFRARSNDLRDLRGVNAPMLQLLDCANNDISSLQSIGRLNTPSLKVLNLSNNDISDLSDLGGLAYLEAVCVSSNDIKQVRSIMAMINSCPSLKYLDLRNNDLPESNKKQLEEICKYHTPFPIKLLV